MQVFYNDYWEPNNRAARRHRWAEMWGESYPTPRRHLTRHRSATFAGRRRGQPSRRDLSQPAPPRFVLRVEEALVTVEILDGLEVA